MAESRAAGLLSEQLPLRLGEEYFAHDELPKGLDGLDVSLAIQLEPDDDLAVFANLGAVLAEASQAGLGRRVHATEAGASTSQSRIA